MTIVSKKSNPELWQRVVSKYKSSSKWWESWTRSARKAQLAVKEYKSKWGWYSWSKSSSNSLAKWTKQDWRTKSWKLSKDTWERYMPAKAIKSLSSSQYSASSAAKRKWWWTWSIVKNTKTVTKVIKKYSK